MMKMKMKNQSDRENQGANQYKNAKNRINSRKTTICRNIVTMTMFTKFVIVAPFDITIIWII